MKRTVGLICLLSFAVVATGCATPGAKCPQAKCTEKCKIGCPKAAKMASFGEPMKGAAGDRTCVRTVLAHPKKYDGKHMKLCGVVDSVCPRMGCWIRLSDGVSKDKVFVKFTCPIEGRLIPMEAEGKRAIIEGKVSVRQVPEDEARHYKEDEGASPDEIAKIVGPQKMIFVNGKGALVEGIKGT